MIIINSKPKRARPSVTPTNSLYYLGGNVNCQLTTCTQGWHLPADIFETENALVVKIEIPGMDERDFQIYVDASTLSVSGYRHDPTESPRAYHQMEIRYGEFSFSVDLPVAIEIEKVTANYRNGILILNLPKMPPHSISINEEP